jgi:hypothetical protein
LQIRLAGQPLTPLLLADYLAYFLADVNMEGPMEAWESGPGANATEEEADAMWAKLRERFLREQRAAVAALLDSWGLGDTLAEGVGRGNEKV